MPMPKVGQVVNGYRYSGGDPNTPTSWLPLSGDDYLNAIPRDRALMAKNMADGKIPYPGSFALKSPQWLAIIEDAQRYDPSFDGTLWQARVKMRSDANSGKIGQTVNAINTAIQHAGVLAKLESGTWDTNFPAFNAVANFASKELGKPGVTNYDNAKSALAHELRRVYAQVGSGTQADLEKFEDNLATSGSKDQKFGGIKTQMELLTGKMNSLRDQYKNIMGPTAAPLEILHPETVTALQALGFKPEDLGLPADEFGTPDTAKTDSPPSAAAPATFGMQRSGAPNPGSPVPNDINALLKKYGG